MKSNPDKYALWQKRVERWQTSDIPAKKWCEENNIVYPTFQYWRAKIRPNLVQREKTPIMQSGFAELIDQAHQDNSGVEIVLGKAIVRLHKGFDAATLRACLCALGG